MEKPNTGAAALAALSIGIAMHAVEVPQPIPSTVIASRRDDHDGVIVDDGPENELWVLEAPRLTAPELMSARRPIYQWWQQESEHEDFLQGVIKRRNNSALLSILSEYMANSQRAHEDATRTSGAFIHSGGQNPSRPASVHRSGQICIPLAAKS
jgi:hypothetical protein